MSLNMKTNIANRANYGKVRDLNSIKYLVVHYTGNDGDTDENNGIYFAREEIYVSAHYFVDDDSVTQSVPDNHVAWHCGGAAKHQYCRNENSIGVEICDDVRNGTIYPSAQTVVNALELVQFLMDKYNIPKSNVIRHYDVTGKSCPAYWVNDAKWKAEFWNKLHEPNTKAVYTVTATGQFASLEAAMNSLEYIESVGFSGVIEMKQNATVVSKPVVPETSKSAEEVAREIIKGIGGWGNGAERKRNLIAKGYDYYEVQSIVNSLLK